MKVSLNWLADYIALPTDDVAAIREAFESLGHEVEGIEVLEPDWTEVVIAEVVSIEPHPDADKVRLCQVVYDDARTPVDVVCGAWNFDVGAIVPFAKPGAVLPGGFEIGRRKIRGVQSNGMICSERELEIGDDAAGILVLDPDAPVGVDFADYVDLPDVVFDLSITPNRPDAMSMMGIARELSAYFDVPYEMVEPKLPTALADEDPQVEPKLPPVPGTPSTRVDIEDPTGCLRFTGREIRNVEIGPSPFWIRQRLRVAGVRAISNAVDVTNYVMLEFGHPLHAPLIITHKRVRDAAQSHQVGKRTAGDRGRQPLLCARLAKLPGACQRLDLHNVFSHELTFLSKQPVELGSPGVRYPRLG